MRAPSLAVCAATALAAFALTAPAPAAPPYTRLANKAERDAMRKAAGRMPKGFRVLAGIILSQDLKRPQLVETRGVVCAQRRPDFAVRIVPVLRSSPTAKTWRKQKLSWGKEPHEDLVDHCFKLTR